jgi:membrane fusion protein, multidrug efflux system
MAEPVLKIAPQPDVTTAPEPRKRTLRERLRARLRLILLVIVPTIALAAGLTFYLMGGRYISTDNAYVGAQKVLITPDISGKVSRVLVKEGQHVAAGDNLFEIDPVPFRLAVTQAQSKLDTVRTDFANLKSNYRSLATLVELSKKNIALKQRDVDRKTSLVASRATSQSDLDTALAAVVTAHVQSELGVRQRDTVLNQLLGNPDLPIEDFPPYQLAKAALEQAQRDLDHTQLKAPIAGTATQVDNIQLGRFVIAGTPVFSVIDDSAPWVDANPKETDITYLRIGQKVDIVVDSFPGLAFRGTVTSVSPGTGAQFAILPPQNASGNWIKVVQRVPLRITFDAGQDLSLLRAGMSVIVDIDTGRRRSLASLFGGTVSIAEESKR